MTTRLRELPLDILLEEINYLRSPEEVRALCSDSFVYQRLCENENNEIWQNLFKNLFTDNIELDEGETVMSQFIRDREQLRELKRTQDVSVLLIFALNHNYNKILTPILDKILSGEVSSYEIDEAWREALKHGKTRALEFLESIQEPPIPNIKNLLKYITRHGNVEALKYFLNKYMVTYQAPDGSNLIDFDYSAINPYFKITGYIIEAIKSGNVNMVRYLFEFACDYGLAFLDSNAYTDSSPQTIIDVFNGILIFAATHGNLPILQYLLNESIIVDHVNIHSLDELALRNAVENNHLDMARYLIEYGANVDKAIEFCERFGQFKNAEKIRKFLS